MWPMSECLLDVGKALEDISIICNGRSDLEVWFSKEAFKLEVGSVASLVLVDICNGKPSLEVGLASSLLVLLGGLEVGLAASLLVLLGNANDLEEARAVEPECNRAASPEIENEIKEKKLQSRRLS